MIRSTATAREWIVAIDGGGTKIDVAAQLIGPSDPLPDSLERAERWNYQGTGSAHPSTWSTAQQNLEHAVRTVCAQLAETQAPLNAIVFALAGAGRPADKERIRSWATSLQDLKGCRSVVCVGDIEPIVDYRKDEALATPTLAVILGTGSIVAARNWKGEIIRAGGWGPNLGDECSGGAIGNAALRKVVEWFDRAEPFEQANRLVFDVASALARTNGLAVDPSSAVDRDALATLLIATAAERTAAAALAPLVISLALDCADHDAREVLVPQLDRLVWQIDTVRQRVIATSKSKILPQETELVFAGGLALNSPSLQRAVAAACGAKSATQVRVTSAEPLLAALRFAINLARWTDGR